MLSACRTGMFFLALFAAAAAAQTQPKLPLANIGPVAVDFGAIKMGDTVTVPVTVKNLSPTTVSIASGGINGSAQFAIDPATCGSMNYMVASGGSCYFVFSFTPTDSGGTIFSTSSAILVQTASLTQVARVDFSGSGTEALVEVTPVSIDFGDTFIGQQVMMPVTITNTHHAAISAVGGAPGGNGTFGASTDCGGTTVAVNPCRFYYTFTPSATGPAQATASLSIGTTVPTAMSQNFPIALKGNGVATLPTPNMAVWPVGIDFGRIKVGHAATVPFYYRNNSSSDISVAGGGFNDSQGNVFGAFDAGGPGCTTQAKAPGVTCSDTYQLVPHAMQAYSNSTGIDFSSFGNTYFVSYAFNGTGVGTLARVSPTTVDLGAVAFDSSASVPVVITNTSDNPLSNFTGGQMNTPFDATSNCPATLAVGQSCSYTYRFATPFPRFLKANYTATTLLSFNNTGSNPNNIQPIVPITITAHVADRIFGDGLEP